VIAQFILVVAYELYYLANSEWLIQIININKCTFELNIVIYIMMFPLNKSNKNIYILTVFLICLFRGL